MESKFEKKETAEAAHDPRADKSSEYKKITKRILYVVECEHMRSIPYGVFDNPKSAEVIANACCESAEVVEYVRK